MNPLNPQNFLPIDDVLPQVIAALRSGASVVLQAPTGAGKTTRVPPAILDAGLIGDKQIVMLEPRRLAARAAARRMAYERNGNLGDEIGYQVRFDKKAGPKTRILVVTEGVLVRMLQDDPFLEKIGTVVFDEFHERSLDTDLALGMVRLVQQTVRPDLRMVVMSATLAAESVAKYLGDCPVVTSAGRLFPVDITYEPKLGTTAWPNAVAQAVEKMLSRTAGDLLVFLPGLGEIRQTSKQLEPLARDLNLAVLPLYGDLPPEQQDAALSRGDRRKVVLATNVAETSVTVEGVTGVIDTGLARTLIFDPHVGLDRLQITPISQASAEQRAGRAGRLQPGVCLRLWSAGHHRLRPEQTEPEIRRVDLTASVLQLLCWGEAGVREFPWFEPPREVTIAQAESLLRVLGAMDDRGTTPLGRELARLPVHPRIGRLLVEGKRRGCLERAALAGALLSERDPFTREFTRGSQPIRSHVTTSDVLERVEALEEFEDKGRADSPLGHINRGSARYVLNARDQLVRLLQRGVHAASQQDATGTGTALKRSLLTAFPDRVACRREPGSPRGVMVGGRGVRLDPASGVTESELFVCVDIDAGKAECLVRQASAIEREWLPAELLTSAVEVMFDAANERVIARKRTRFADIVLDETTAPLPNDEQSARVLAEAAAADFSRVLPPADSAAVGYLGRLRSLRQWMPDLELPAFDDEQLKELLVTLAYGCRSFADLRQANWLAGIQSSLTPRQIQAIAREAPEQMTVPSGSQITLQYEAGRPPVLAVRIQEVFGWKDTPRIAGGRIRVLLHLLGPNYRPQQITDDLASFWANGYPEVRKELKRRYPKHAWPDDPVTAQAEQRPQRRS